MQQRAANDYAIGPGDVLEINVAGVEEMKNISERVTGDETVSLPFVGIINTKGFTDKTLRSEIRRRLETNYVRNPQVSLFVKEFRSRQVAVIGAVQKPGLYNLASSADTILSMISQAGGTTDKAAERIMFIPAEPAAPDKAKEVISAMPVQLLSQDPSPLILKNVDPIVINLDSVNRSGNQMYLNMPALPGDIVMVPGGGEVLIQGWVEKPGAYKITSGLTILGAMAAAGGTVKWSRPDPDAIVIDNPTSLRTRVRAMRPGRSAIDVSAHDDAGNQLESMKIQPSVPQFVTVDEEAAGLSRRTISTSAPFDLDGVIQGVIV
jgi:polysaccharide export outer membrane protein